MSSSTVMWARSWTSNRVVPIRSSNDNSGQRSLVPGSLISGSLISGPSPIAPQPVEPVAQEILQLHAGALAFLVGDAAQAGLGHRVVDAEHALDGVRDHRRIEVLHPVGQDERRGPAQLAMVAQDERVAEASFVTGESRGRGVVGAQGFARRLTGVHAA